MSSTATASIACLLLKLLVLHICVLVPVWLLYTRSLSWLILITVTVEECLYRAVPSIGLREWPGRCAALTGQLNIRVLVLLPRRDCFVSAFPKPTEFCACTGTMSSVWRSNAHLCYIYMRVAGTGNIRKCMHRLIRWWLWVSDL